MARIALVGIGTMGLPMGRNLLAAGHEVVGCDVDPARTALLGVPHATTPAEAVRGAEMVILSLPSVEIVERAALGPDGVVEAVVSGSLVADMSTSPPALARRLAQGLAVTGALFVDAPVSGGPMGAEAATLTIMVGGIDEAFQRARPVFEALGRPVHVGGHGAGQAAKLCNNLVAGATMAALAECCAIAKREGIEAALLYDILSTSTGDSRVLRNRFPLPGADEKHPSNRDFEPLFAVDLIAKDLELAIELARQHGVEPAMIEKSLQQYRKAQADGFGALDYSAVFRSVERGP